jgi:CoA:oxalate CoA-transferase
VLAVLAERQWQGVCTVIGRPDLADDPRLASGRDRSRHHDALVEPAVTAWCRQRTKAECTEAFLAAGVPAAPVNTTADLVDCPQIAAREMLVEATAPAVGTVRVVGNPIKLGGRTAAGAAVRIPQLGADTIAVLRDDLGLTEHEVATLERDGVVRSAP